LAVAPDRRSTQPLALLREGIERLSRYRRAIGAAEHLDRLTALLGNGYFSVWTTLGSAAYPLRVALAALEMRQPALTTPERAGIRRGSAPIQGLKSRTKV
jgi:predicted metal-binding membrane protein